MQVYPFVDGRRLYQVYASPGQITDIALQPGEQLVGAGPVAAGDTARWIIGDTESGTGAAKQIVHILVKPTRPDLLTNPSSTPTAAPTTWNCARRLRPIWRRSPGNIRGPAHRAAPPECQAQAQQPSPTGIDPRA